jgi:hypothetical protein
MADMATAYPRGFARWINTGSRKDLYTLRALPVGYVLRIGALLGVRPGAIRMVEPVDDDAPRADLDIVGVYDGPEDIGPGLLTGGDGEAVDVNGHSIRVRVRDGDLEKFDTAASAPNKIAPGDVGKACYAKNDNELWLTNDTNTLSFAGYVADVDVRGKVTLRVTFDVRAANKRYELKT